MTEQKLKFWSLKNKVPHLLDKPVVLETTEHMTRGTPTLNNALERIIAGKAIDVPIDEIVTAVKNALLKTGHEAPQILTMAISGLALQRECLKPPAKTNKQKPDKTKRSGTLRSSMSKAAQPPPPFDPDNNTYKTLGRMAYDTEKKHLFIDEQYTPTPLPYIAMAIGELMDRFPAPITIEEIEQIAVANLNPGQTSYSIQMLEKLFNDFVRKLKRDNIFNHKPVVKGGPKGTDYYLIADLTALSSEQEESMDLTTVKDVSISLDRKTIWKDGKITDEPKFTKTQLTLIELFMSHYGEYIDKDQVNGRTQASITLINEKLTALNFPNIHTEKMPQPDNRVLGFAMCANDEWNELILSRTPHQIKPQRKKPSMPDEGTAFAPQFL